MRILFALPGFHRVERGAEVAMTSIAKELAERGDEVTLMGSGPARDGMPYRFIHVGAVSRSRFERMPRLPALRDESAYEEATFAMGLLRQYRPASYDLTVACSFPFVHWALRRAAFGGRRPPHVFVTQNGDWPIRAANSEYRYFACEGVVCLNPDYFASARAHWPSALIPNGVALERFAAGPPQRPRFGLPEGRKIVLMVSALIASKRVADGIRAVASLPDAHLVCAGDGPERTAIDELAADLLPGRFTRLTVAGADMPMLYNSCDAFLHLSLDEPFGNVFVEALACGLPVVAEDSARTRWIVGNQQFLCDTTNQSSLAAAVSRAFSAGPSGASERRLQASQFGWPIVASKYRAFFKDVVARYQEDHLSPS